MLQNIAAEAIGGIIAAAVIGVALFLWKKRMISRIAFQPLVTIALGGIWFAVVLYYETRFEEHAPTWAWGAIGGLVLTLGSFALEVYISARRMGFGLDRITDLSKEAHTDFKDVIRQIRELEMELLNERKLTTQLEVPPFECTKHYLEALSKLSGAMDEVFNRDSNLVKVIRRIGKEDLPTDCLEMIVNGKKALASPHASSFDTMLKLLKAPLFVKGQREVMLARAHESAQYLYKHLLEINAGLKLCTAQAKPKAQETAIIERFDHQLQEVKEIWNIQSRDCAAKDHGCPGLLLG